MIVYRILHIPTGIYCICYSKNTEDEDDFYLRVDSIKAKACVYYNCGAVSSFRCSACPFSHDSKHTIEEYLIEKIK